MFETDTIDNTVIEYFKARIASKNIEIECIYRDVFINCREYLSKFDTPDFVLRVDRAELDRERICAHETCIAEGREPIYLSNPRLETLAVYRKLATVLLDDGFLLIHGAAVAADNKCYIFMAKSGTGKTTHIRKWLSLYPETFVVNGDKPLVDVENMLVWGTPWCGKEKMGTNTSVPLGGFIRLERGEKNEIEKIPFSDMLPCLMQQCFIPEDSAGTVKVMRLISKLQSVPCWHLRCNMENEAGKISYEAIHG